MRKIVLTQQIRGTLDLVLPLLQYCDSAQVSILFTRT